jgi:hypothetical protein
MKTIFKAGKCSLFSFGVLQQKYTKLCTGKLFSKQLKAAITLNRNTALLPF